MTAHRSQMKKHKEIFAHQVMYVPRIQTAPERKQMTRLKQKAVAANVVGTGFEIHANSLARERAKGKANSDTFNKQMMSSAAGVGAKSLAGTYQSTIKDIELQGYRRGLKTSKNTQLKNGQLYKSSWTESPIVKTKAGYKVKLQDKPISDRRARKNIRWQEKVKAGGTLAYYKRKLKSGKTIRVKKGKR